MTRVEIWINPACSKCAAATDVLDSAGVTYSVRRYLDDPPSTTELEDVLQRMGLEPWDVARLSEERAAELGLADLGRTPENRDRWIELMVANPVLIQRPILTADDGRAVVARTEAAVRSVLD